MKGHHYIIEDNFVFYLYIFLKKSEDAKYGNQNVHSINVTPNNFYTSCVVGFLSADMASVEYTLSNRIIFWVLSVLIKWTISDSPRLRKSSNLSEMKKNTCRSQHENCIKTAFHQISFHGP